MKEEIQHLIDVYKSDIESRHHGRYYGNDAEWEQYEARIETLQEVVSDLESILNKTS
jgi:hypothetical protein